MIPTSLCNDNMKRWLFFWVAKPETITTVLSVYFESKRHAPSFKICIPFALDNSGDDNIISKTNQYCKCQIMWLLEFFLRFVVLLFKTNIVYHCEDHIECHNTVQVWRNYVAIEILWWKAVQRYCIKMSGVIRV